MTHPLPTGTVEACVVVARQAARDNGTALAPVVSKVSEMIRAAAFIEDDVWQAIVRAVIAEALQRVNTKAGASNGL